MAMSDSLVRGPWRGAPVDPDDVAYLSEFDHLTLVRLLIARYRRRPDPAALDEAVRLLARLPEAAEASGRAGSLIEIQRLIALALAAQGHRPQALQALAQAWGEAPDASEAR